ncbi:hypothetical protein [Dermatobacter hominis]|uniref:hypothetical protein n=1 Tax=Dermatobacter hominis TaxID=2884263 RepID=UPI001D11B0C0|nr:hypothetical protein [Dermatobacter hominis]UDY35844.1 hypothetical protein LH044_21315 [Dermatobacter hominis]
MEQDEWTEYAAGLLAEPLVASGWFRPAHVGAPLAAWEPSLPSFVASASEWEMRRIDDRSRLEKEFVTDLPRLMFVAVTAHRLGLFDLVGRRHVHARRAVATAERDGVLVAEDAAHPDWLCLRLDDGRAIALEPAGPDEDVESIRRVLTSEFL